MLKKLFSLITIFSLITSYLPVPVFAQTATDSAAQTQASSSAQTSNTATVSASLNNSPFNEVFVNSSLAPTNNAPSYVPPLVFPSLDTVLPGSANFNTNQNKKWAVAPNTKHDLKGDEVYRVEVNDISSQNINAEVLDAKGNKAAADLEKIDTANGTVLTILPPKNFKPGKYTLKLIDQNGNIQTQDFTWGVLAINTNKSIYLSSEALAKEGLPPETANLAMAVLDDSGNMVCDANVKLNIKNKILNIDDTVSTDNGKITINPECQVHGYTTKPDYEAHYQVSGAGTYDMTLTADTKNGQRTINDSFQVQGSVPFDVERATGTRIYPPATYPVNFNIKVNQDFNGQIIEYVPSSFQVFPATEGASFTVKNIAAPIASSTNTFGTFLNLGLPYKGNISETLGFGQHLPDLQEKDLYAKFGLLGHDGLDFEMPIGTPVYSADDGTVVMAGGQIYGTTVVIQHSWGRSYYGHLSKVNVALGQNVSKGQEIALSGNTGITTGPHLHFSIKLNANDSNNGYYGKTDPSPYLSLSNNSAVLGASTINDTIKAIVWDVNVKKGDTLNLSYFFKTPNVSPYFYTLGPLSFYDQNQNPVFQEARVWQLAIDASFPATSYLSNTASAQITSTISWQIVTTAPSTSDVTTSCKNAKTTGYCQEKPGAANKTNGLTVPTAPNGTGWIYDTALNSTIPTGAWTFNVKTTSSSATGTGFITVCAWKVTISAGAITGSSNFINCVDGATNVQSVTTALASSVSVASVPAQSFSQSQYLYVEYWLHTTVAGTSATGNVAFEANAGAADDIVTPGSSSNLAPNAPTGLSTTSIGQTSATLQMTATDPESNNIQYDVLLYANDSSCSTGSTTDYDESVSQAGWSGQNATCTSGLDCYTSGTQGSLSASSLTAATNYSWKSRAKDPQGLNTFGSYSSCTPFTTQAAGPTLDQLLRHGEWFNSSGVRQPFTF